MADKGSAEYFDGWYARLVGVDFSAEAVRQARRRAELLGRAAVFRVGDLVATGLETGAV